MTQTTVRLSRYSTIVASLLPILVVTPVIFAWLRERECRGETAGVK